MKSNNQGVKEETFIHTGRRGRDGQPGQTGLMVRQWLADPARWQLADWAVPHSCVDKLGGRTGEGDRVHNTGFQHQEIKPQTSE